MTGSIDWETVWNSLNWDDDQRHQTTEIERLRLRARQYASSDRDHVSVPDANKSVLTFDLGSEQYGVDVMMVRGVRSVGRIARVPNAPAFYRGIINIRGRIVTVMDLRRFFDIAVEDAQEPSELVLVRANNLELGLLAHQVNGVMAVPLAAIKPVEHMPYMLGMSSSRVVVLNVIQLFEDERLMVGGVNNGGQAHE